MNRMDSISSSRPICQECGADADVHVSNIVGAEKVVYHLCQLCADEFQVDHPTGRRRSGFAAMVITFGAMTTLISLFADPLAMGDGETFGWQQKTGLIVAGILVLLGAVMRAQTLLMLGVFLGVLDLLADWLHLGSQPGFGIQQLTGTLVGMGIILVGVFVARARRRTET